MPHTLVCTVYTGGQRHTFDGRELELEDRMRVQYRAQSLDDTIGSAKLEWVEINGVRYTDVKYTMKVEQG